MGLGIGPIARLRALLDSRCSWYEELVVSEEAKSELQFWLTNLDGRGIWRSASAVCIQMLVALGLVVILLSILLTASGGRMR